MDINYKDIINKKIIDIRNNYSYINGHIPNSINIIENKLLMNPGMYLNRNNEYVVYCDYGNRSKKVASYLDMNGYKVYSLIGGYNEYLKNI